MNMQDMRKLLERMQLELERQGKESNAVGVGGLLVRPKRLQSENQRGVIGDLGERHTHDIFGLDRRTVRGYSAIGFDTLRLRFRMELELLIERGVEWGMFRKATLSLDIIVF